MTEHEESIARLIPELYLREIRHSQSMTPTQRFLAGPRLFDQMRILALAGIRAKNPSATDEEVNAIFLRRLEVERKLEALRAYR